ncbi:HNH endonuclease signature motif containing protein [Streptomyces antibioticus]|uniref:HNH endonuclease signature motif containing protein n=1 Tax=Streptomyces antibioticus TaxID=1890 RepID=UPI0036B80C40
MLDDVGCIHWRGKVNKGGWGRAKISDRRHHVPAHHVAWAIAFGAIPEDTGLEVDHLCQVRDCLNVAHLEWVTTLENQRRIDLRRPVCRRGHDWSSLVPVFRLDGWVRICFDCLAEGPVKKKTDRRRGYKSKASRMIRCPRGHDVSGDNGYDLPDLPGRRGCHVCTEAWKAVL